MKLILEGESLTVRAMKQCHKIMLDFFGEKVELVKYWGPVQMGVFYLEYYYSERDYRIIMESERGYITIMVKDNDDNFFYPSMIFPESKYYHSSKVEKDVLQLVELTYKAIKEDIIVFKKGNK